MNSSLLIDLYELTMANSYFDYKKDTTATFDLFIRQLPPQRNYFIFAGLHHVLRYLENIRFGKEEVEYLRTLNLFSDEFLNSLKKFRFRGNVWAMPEGTIFFPEEPVIRITAPIIEAQIVESAILSIVNLEITMATKASRVVVAAKNRPVYDFSLRRTHGLGAAGLVARSSYISGCSGTSNVHAGKCYDIPITGTMAHSFIMSFPSELAGFIAFSRSFPQRTILLIDTYREMDGVRNAIKVAREMEKRGTRLMGVRLDSGNLLSLSKRIRRLLDKEGLGYVKIIASGNLDEYKIDDLVKKRARIDSFGVGTHMGTSSDIPFSDVIYKVSATTDGEGRFLPTMKLSQAKKTYPGTKQVWRRHNANGMFKEDIISLDAEKFVGAKQLLIKVMENGKRIYDSPHLEKIRKYCTDELNSLPERYKRIKKPVRFPIRISPGLRNLTKKTSLEIQHRGKGLGISPFVLMDIDTQYDFINECGKLKVSGAYKIVGNLKRITEFAGKNNIMVFASMDNHRKNDPEFRKFPPHCVTGAMGQKKIRETVIAPQAVFTYKKKYTEDEIKRKIKGKPSIILEKNHLSVFTNPNTETLLRDVVHVYLYGVATEYCVREAAMGLRNRGIRVTVIKDAIRAVKKKDGDRAIKELKERGVDFIDTDTFLGKGWKGL